jgi:hypothetical protein
MHLLIAGQYTTAKTLQSRPALRLRSHVIERQYHKHSHLLVSVLPVNKPSPLSIALTKLADELVQREIVRRFAPPGPLRSLLYS